MGLLGAAGGQESDCQPVKFDDVPPLSAVPTNVTFDQTSLAEDVDFSGKPPSECSTCFCVLVGSLESTGG